MAISERDYTKVGSQFFECMYKLKAEYGDLFKGFNIEDGVIYIDICSDASEETINDIKDKLLQFNLRR